MVGDRAVRLEVLRKKGETGLRVQRHQPPPAALCGAGIEGCGGLHSSTSTERGRQGRRGGEGEGGRAGAREGERENCSRSSSSARRDMYPGACAHSLRVQVNPQCGMTNARPDTCVCLPSRSQARACLQRSTGAQKHTCWRNWPDAQRQAALERSRMKKSAFSMSGQLPWRQPASESCWCCCRAATVAGNGGDELRCSAGAIQASGSPCTAGKREEGGGGGEKEYVCDGTCNSDGHAAVETGGEEVIHGAQSLHLLIARMLSDLFSLSQGFFAWRFGYAYRFERRDQTLDAVSGYNRGCRSALIGLHEARFSRHLSRPHVHQGLASC